MSEENKMQGHSGTGGKGGLLGRLFGKKNDEGDGAAVNVLDEMIDEENRDVPAERTPDDAETEDIPAASFDDPADDIKSSADEISDDDYSDILSEILGGSEDASPAADDIMSDTVPSEKEPSDAESDDAENEPSDGAELLKKIMSFRAAGNAAPGASVDESGEAPDIHEDVGANTDVFEDYEDATDTDDTEDATDTAESDAEPSGDKEDEEKKTEDDDGDEDLMLALGYGGNGSNETSDAQSGGAKGGRGELDRHIRDTRPDYAGAFGYRGEEYRSRGQTEDVRKAYRADSLGMILRACGTAILTLVIFIFEIFGKKFGGALSMSDYPTVHILVSMQLLLLAAAISWRQMINGLIGIFRFELTPHSAAAAAVAVVLIYDAALAIASPESFTLYNLPAALCLVMSVVYDILDLERQIRVFNSLSSWESYCTLEKADAVELAAALGSSSSGRREDASIRSAMRLRRGGFAENYFSYTNRKNPALKALNYVIAPVIALSLVIFLISIAAGRGFVPSANTFTVMVLIAMPVFTMAALIYPFCDLSKNVLKPSEVLLCESEAENYASADAVVFGEADVFGPRSLLIKRIGLCGSAAARDIFGILDGASAVFDKVGGTLAGAFRRAAESGAPGPSEAETDAEILRVCDGGIAARAGGREYIIGCENFMTLNGIKAPADPDDASFAADGGSAVMYIAVDGEVSLKMYVTYIADDSFRSMVSTLSERGISPVLVSNDPNIDDALLLRLLGELKCPVRVIHDASAYCRGEDDEADESNSNEQNETVNAGLIADGSDWTSLVGAISACGKLCRVSSLNRRVCLGIIAVSVLLAAFLGALGILNGMHSMYVALYQVICVLPAVISSKLMLN